MAAERDDAAQILALMHANRIAMWTADFEAWKKSFVHADYTPRWGWWRPGGIFIRRGWDERGRVHHRPRGTIPWRRHKDGPSEGAAPCRAPP